MLKVKRFFHWCLWLTTLYYNCISTSYARTSLGIGVNEEPITQGGVFFSLLMKIHFWQMHFERLMSKALLSFQNNPHAAFWLVGLSFLYGLFHSLGPGHGKMVISSYIFANNSTLKRGLLIAFCASMLQALVAIVVILTVFLLLPIRWTDAASWMTSMSFFLVMLLGLYMLYRATKRLFRYKTTQCECGCSCGHQHIVLAQEIDQNFDWRTAISAIFAIGLRPCSGALLIMSFAMIQQIYYPGILAVMAMAVGTFITISLLAILAVKAKSLANYYLKQSQKGTKTLIILEWIFALVLFLMGLALAASSLI